jgi:hypothetical protein
MKDLKVIAWKNLPTRLPIWGSLVVWLTLDRLHAPGWVYGAAGAVVGIIWIICIVLLIHEKQVDIFEPRSRS